MKYFLCLVEAGPIDCQELTCQNGGTCVARVNSEEECVCNNWFTGDTCKYCKAEWHNGTKCNWFTADRCNNICWEWMITCTGLTMVC